MFSSVEDILQYNYKNKGEVNQALGALEAMYGRKSIQEKTYKNTKKLLEDKLKSLK